MTDIMEIELLLYSVLPLFILLIVFNIFVFIIKKIKRILRGMTVRLEVERSKEEIEEEKRLNEVYVSE